ncbi:SDR family NAD(P)-dependent oxidoreductase [Neisseria weaveri]|uniref:3-oxoacyl-ACP reductase n=1 Tax=Neisseria weaveri TaxID=28091 RepID=A0A448VQK1_9NEIS|nr:SDR family NAD(P)-dependent oxidoreductase [Neisseria weaveri]EGV34704.1 oxidoreductase, short-chain dehydrogenase/reductase family [Neisseria weaveri ATCC 51223]EGV35794.1 oxidoreductase, short-chain dehydrogenase/reductase family [Neisseria weaveri LMG 5135]SAY50635.1 3-oxoacyl-ACP reductase [Neisseria weaveri]VEJ52047.1 3-oxoacyl-ACP reductase [Neisseria weaveri]
MKTILITGCSTGIGYDTAKQLHAMGWRVFAGCRRPEDVERLKHEGLADALKLDVTDSGNIRQVFQYIAETTGGHLDALFCNAGYGQAGAVEDISRHALREQFETNVFGAWECISEAMRLFRRQGHGRILVNSSILGFAAMPWRGAYNSSKFALEGMCDTLRHEVAGSNIFVSLIEPGPIATRFRPNALIKFKQHIDIENSVHQAAYQAQLNRLEAEGSVAPFTMSSPDCAAVCVKALTAGKPKARYLVTFPTILFWYLKRILPTFLLDRLQRGAVKGQGK